MIDIKNFSRSELERHLKEQGYPGFHAGQIFSWLYGKGVLDFDAMTNLPERLREYLGQCFRIQSSRLVREREADDGTKKLLLELDGGALIETVLIPFQTTPLKRRLTGCVSSQAGCRFGCGICASGLAGFKRNLRCGEILEQVVRLNEAGAGDRVSHLVFMGVGEPLDNYDTVLKAVRIINSRHGFNIGARRITISTCGVIPGIDRLSREKLQVELSVSLHAADDRIRTKLMPVNKRYPLAKLINACRRYVARTNRQVTFEYVVVPGVNTGKAAVKSLAALLKGLNGKLNLIPFNPVKELPYKRPSRAAVRSFRDDLQAAGLRVTVRRSRGGTIAAACGQLRLSELSAG